MLPSGEMAAVCGVRTRRRVLRRSAMRSGEEFEAGAAFGAEVEERGAGAERGTGMGWACAINGSRARGRVARRIDPRSVEITKAVWNAERRTAFMATG